ncbi:hypothetical protein MUK51_18410 [Sphingobacterium faecium]|uniref:hypothetical protein n=1 Tax=Sphingobacterium faecium TaxID=34087 RepID=UPI0021B58D4F|nr:hypothetical protein [Sphingobacterium faecium]UXD69153.1 hypothetical protein MUK51_18410 [Sphingobacterium faecium]
MNYTTRRILSTDQVTENDIEIIKTLAEDIFMRMRVVNDMFKDRVTNDPILTNQLNIRLSNIDTLFFKFCKEYCGEFGYVYAPIKLQIFFYSTTVEEFLKVIKSDLDTMSKKYRFRFSKYA